MLSKKAKPPSVVYHASGKNQHGTNLQVESIEGDLRMTAEFVVGLVTCIATVAGTVIAALSYFKDRE